MCVDEQRRLVGVLSMRDLILAPPGSLLGNIMIPGVKSVPATMDQEEVARQMRSSQFLALPVVDADQRLCGQITLDDVMDVIQEEATEDVQRMFGAGAEERLNSSWQFSFSKRIWWLQVNLATALLAALVIAMFGGIAQPAFGAGDFYPDRLKHGKQRRGAGHVGGHPRHHARPHRSQTPASRPGQGSHRRSSQRRRDRHHHHHHRDDVAIPSRPGPGSRRRAAIVITQTLACVSGAAIPFVMRRLGFDPAQSATIFATTITDVAGFASLLGLATICAGWMR